ncbi:Uncharacterised protein [Mycobacteroides abscessus subsp. abscessus]|nr:Uncharacterised protein [Mycobacteroides abscessus subsp. abscessus]
MFTRSDVTPSTVAGLSLPPQAANARIEVTAIAAARRLCLVGLIGTLLLLDEPVREIASPKWSRVSFGSDWANH